MNHREFLQTTMWELLIYLEANTAPRWGVMTAQHMIEHIAMVLGLAPNGVEMGLLVDEAKAQRNYQRTIVEKMPLPRNIKFAGGVLAEPMPLQFAGMEKAMDNLRDVVQNFLDFFDQNPDAQPTHPVLGKLSRADWFYFQCLHIQHHFVQFGLLPEDTGVPA